MSKHRVLSLKPPLPLEWRGQDGQNETEQPEHSASSGDSITSSTQIGFSVHTAHILRLRAAERGLCGVMSVEEIPVRLAFRIRVCLDARAVDAHGAVGQDGKVKHVALPDMCNHHLILQNLGP